MSSREEKSQKDYSTCDRRELEAAMKRLKEISPEKIKREVTLKFEKERKEMTQQI